MPDEGARTSSGGASPKSSAADAAEKTRSADLVRAALRRSHRIRAHNDAVASENKIHDDAVARQYGFSGGLVPGVTVFAYLAHAPAAAWGRPWLERGTLAARFLQPVYEDEEIVVSAEPDGDAGLDVVLTGPDGAVRAAGRAALPRTPWPPPDLTGWPSGPLPPPEERPPASPEVLSSIELGTVEAGWQAARATEYLEQIGEDLPLFREEEVAHPGWLLRPANLVLSGSVRLGPWIHVSSDVTNHGIVRDGDRVTTMARVAGLSERKGHRFVDLDVVMAVEGRPVMSVRHVAIYQPRKPEG